MTGSPSGEGAGGQPVSTAPGPTDQGPTGPPEQTVPTEPQERTGPPGPEPHPAHHPPHGSIVLIESACTSCMICARECPVWCISIDSHTEPLADQPPGGRVRTTNVLDRFAIDWSVCMYCGICVEECPFDALAWSRQPTAAAVDAGRGVLIHGIDQLRGPDGAT